MSWLPLFESTADHETPALSLYGGFRCQTTNQSFSLQGIGKTYSREYPFKETYLAIQDNAHASPPSPGTGADGTIKQISPETNTKVCKTKPAKPRPMPESHATHRPVTGLNGKTRMVCRGRFKPIQIPALKYRPKIPADQLFRRSGIYHGHPCTTRPHIIHWL